MTDWQLSLEKVKDRGLEILSSGQWADCSFLVGRDQEKLPFSAHRLFLSMASPVFDRMLNGPMANSSCIEIPDIHPETFRDMLLYIYGDKIDVGTIEEACDLYECAQKYMLPHLSRECMEYIRRQRISPQNVVQIYELSRLHDVDLLLNECFQVIQTRTMALLADPSFTTANLITVEYILGLDVLNIDSELDLYIAVEKYAKAHGKGECSENVTQSNELLTMTSNTSNISTESNSISTVSATNNNTKLNDFVKESEFDKNSAAYKTFRYLIKGVRILSLTPQQFAEHVAPSPFISKEEAYALLMIISTKNKTLPVPEGFNTSPDCRQRPYLHKPIQRKRYGRRNRF